MFIKKEHLKQTKEEKLKIKIKGSRTETEPNDLLHMLRNLNNTYLVVSAMKALEDLVIIFPYRPFA